MTNSSLTVPTQLFCQVCGKVMPDDKAKRRSNTCSDDCRNTLRRFRVAILNAGKCPHCYHPSTREEWAEFRQWRQWKAGQDDTTLQGFMKATHGLTLRSVTRKLAEGLGDALKAMEARRDQILGESTLKVAGQPDLATLPEGPAKEIAALEKAIAAWLPLLEAAKQVLPEKAVDAKAAD